MNNIILKAKGVRQATREEVMLYQPAEFTASYTPISNKELIMTSLETLDKCNFKVVNEFYKVDSTNQKMVGGLIINSGDSDYNMMLGLKNSGDKSMSAAFALGLNVLICSNSSVIGEEMMVRKHTGKANLEIKEALKVGIEKLEIQYSKIKTDFDKLKEIEITKKTTASLIGQLYLTERIITQQQLALVRDEMNNETYDYGIKDSAYNLYQNITNSLKISHPVNFFKNHAQLHDFFVDEFDLV